HYAAWRLREDRRDREPLHRPGRFSRLLCRGPELLHVGQPYRHSLTTRKPEPSDATTVWSSVCEGGSPASRVGSPASTGLPSGFSRRERSCQTIRRRPSLAVRSHSSLAYGKRWTPFAVNGGNWTAKE